MSEYYLYMFVTVMGIAVFTLQCVGVLILMRSGNSPAKSLMIAGCALYIFVWAGRLIPSLISQGNLTFANLLMVPGYSLSSLIFVIGFVIHALSLRREKERLIELEAIANAQAIEWSG